ncbi:hypothetical protein F4861DRAFT_46085 [Xylaria intraflava]|nr:hypothetical protein F4861DRAFT_46085 [Xylaria intraflava]
MSHPLGDDIGNPGGSINNHPQSPGYPYLQQAHRPYQHQHQHQHQLQPPQSHQPHHQQHHEQHHEQQHEQHHQHHHQHHQQQHHQSLHQYPDQASYFSNTNDDHNNTHHPSAFPAAQPGSRSAFNLGFSSYAAVPGGALTTQASREQGANPIDGAISVFPHKSIRDPRLENLSHQRGGLTTATNGPALGNSPYQSDMRYIRGHLDALNAEQYRDGKFANKCGVFKPETHVLTAANANTVANSQKRGRKLSLDERDEPVEEVKRARGRPRLETGAHQDMKERRKEQIRLAQRAYRNRKETAIVELEAKVAALQASNAEIKATFQSLLMEFVDRHAITAQVPELGRRLQKFQAVLQQQVSDVAGLQSDGVRPHAELSVDNSLQMDTSVSTRKSADNNGSTSQALVAPVTQQPQRLFGGIIVTYEPECQTMAQASMPNLDSALDGSYTYVKMASIENASFFQDMSFLDKAVPTQWSLPQCESLPMPASGAYLERMFSRRLHRRTTEKAATLLAMESPPYDTMHRVFGFVRNYASLENIRQRIKSTLTRNADEDLDAYTQPFHHVGGSGTHFITDAKSPSCSSGAPFPNSGFGMGPFNERTTAVRDELLDMLQRSTFPGWQGEWFDSYDVERYLEEKSIKLPPGGDGYVEIPPGDFYHNPLEERASPTKHSSQELVSKKTASDFNMSPDVSDGISMQTVVHSSLSPLSGSSVDSMLSIPTTTAVWPPGSMASDFMGSSLTMPGTVSPLPAYNNAATLGFPNSPHFVYAPQTISPVGGQVRSKRVWFSVEKFIEALGTKATCVGRGPAFRKNDVILAFWEATGPEPE